MAVNCYVMITGFFLIEKPVFRWNGLIKTWVQTLFYSLGLFLLGCLLFNEQSMSITSACLPVYSNVYWFVTTYIGLLLVAPLLSLVAMYITKRSYQVLLVIYFVCTFQFLYGKVYSGFSTVTWFVYLYLVAGYIKLYGLPKWMVEQRKHIFVLTWLLLFILATGINFLNTRAEFSLISTAYDGPVFFLSVAFFALFVYADDKTVNGRFASMLSGIAPYTFGVYLIHEHPVVSRLLWESIIPVEADMPIVIIMLASVMLIFLVCVLIDYVRSWLFEILHIKKAEEWLAGKIPQIELYER